MTCWIKEGVLGTLTTPMRKCHGRLVRLYETYGLDFYVTSRQEGNHSSGSLHPDGNAEDFRKQSVPFEDIVKVSGPDFDCLDEPDHYHVEYDPKIIK